MATSQTHTGNGSTLSFDITFPFIKSSDVKVSVAGTTKSSPSDYTITGTTVIFGAAPASSAAIKIWRATDVSEATHLYSPGSIITATSLNDNLRQLLYAIEENKNDTLATGEALTWSNSQAKAHIMAEDNTSWIIQNGVIDGDMLKDDIITAGKIVGNAVGAAELANNSVDAGAISSNAVTTDKILDHNVTYGKLQDVSTDHRLLGRDHNTDATVAEVQVATDHIVNDAVTYPKLQNIVTANRVLGRASAGEVQEVQVATNMISDGAVTTAKMAATRFFGSYAILQEVLDHGNAAEDLTIEAWTERPLNTETIDPDGIILGLDNKATSGSLKAASPNGTGGDYSVQPAANRFTLGAGTYFIKWHTNFYKVEHVKSRLKDVTNSAVKAISLNAFSNDAGGYASVNSVGCGRVIITGNTDFALEYFVDHKSSTTSGGLQGPGHANNTEKEVYTTIEIYKEL